MKIKSLNEAMEILQKDTPLSKMKATIGEDISLDAVLKDSSAHITDSYLAQYLSDTINEIGYSKAAVMEKAGIDDVLGFQIFSGIASPTFNTLLRICVGAGFTLEETQTAIRLAGFTPLDSDVPRDRTIIHGIAYMKTVREINNMLHIINERSI